MPQRRLPAALTALVLGLSSAAGLSACSDRQDRDQSNDGGERQPFTQPSPTSPGETQDSPSGSGVQTSTSSGGTDPTP